MELMETVYSQGWINATNSDLSEKEAMFLMETVFPRLD